MKKLSASLQELYEATLLRQLKEGKVQVREVHDPATNKVKSRIVTRYFECDARLFDKFFPPPLFAESALTTILASLFQELDASDFDSEEKAKIEVFLRTFGEKYTFELEKRGLPVQLSLFDAE